MLGKVREASLRGCLIAAAHAHPELDGHDFGGTMFLDDEAKPIGKHFP